MPPTVIVAPELVASLLPSLTKPQPQQLALTAVFGWTHQQSDASDADADAVVGRPVGAPQPNVPLGRSPDY